MGYATDSDKIRWVRGRAESIAGWTRETEATLTGICRSIFAWVSNAGRRYLAFGTHCKLYVFTRARLYDITPIRSTVTLGADPITTTTGSAVVMIAHTAHGATDGATVYLSGATAVGGITVGGAAGSYAASPFKTTKGSPLVLVSHVAHGMVSGEPVTIAGGAAVGGITLSGLYYVDVYNPNVYVIQHSAPATATATGGGTPTFVTEKGYFVTVVDANSYTITHSAPAGSGATGGGAAVQARYEINCGNADAIGAAGYGLGPYGVGPYGIFLGGDPDAEPRIWALDNYGENLTANPMGGRLYQWALNLSQRAVSVANAPAEIIWHVVTAERIVLACGCTNTLGAFDPLLVRNSDIQDITIWTPGPANNAREERLAQGSRIVSARQTRGGTLIWTDTAVYFSRFVGEADQAYVSDVLGVDCGLIAPMAAVVVEGSAFWLSRTMTFYDWRGGEPRMLPSPVRDWIADRLAVNQQFKVHAFYDGAFPAATWLFPTLFINENAEYVRVDLPTMAEDVNAGWSVGTFDRTAWIDRGIFENPIATSAAGVIYRQDAGRSDNGNAISRFVEWAPIELGGDGDGNRVMNCRRAVFDMKIAGGTPQMTFTARRWPNGAEVVKGPYSLSDAKQYQDLRVQGRQMAVRLSSAGTDDEWRIGAPRYDLSQGPLR